MLLVTVTIILFTCSGIPLRLFTGGLFRTLKILALASGGFSILPHVVLAQGADVYGHVSDPQGNVVPHAVVSLARANNKNVQQTYTGNEGQFSFVGLATGKYTLMVIVTGFEADTRTLRIADTQPMTIDIRLKIRQNQQTVTVTDDVKEGNILAPDPVQRVIIRDHELGGLWKGRTAATQKPTSQTTFIDRREPSSHPKSQSLVSWAQSATR